MIGLGRDGESLRFVSSRLVIYHRFLLKIWQYKTCFFLIQNFTHGFSSLPINSLLENERPTRQRYVPLFVFSPTSY